MKGMTELRLMTVSGPMLTVSAPPHVHCGTTVRGLNQRMLLGLAPVMLMAVLTYGLPALRVLAMAGATAVIAEHLCARMFEVKSRVDDLHALCLGLILGCFLPASAPWWLAVAGSVSAVFMGKMIFGGLGSGPLSAAMVGWAVCRLSWSAYMSPEFTVLDSTLPTVLFDLQNFGPKALEDVSYFGLFMGQQIGFLGASQTLAAIVGGAILLYTKRVRWEIPAGFLGGVLVFATIWAMLEPGAHPCPVVHLLAGSTIFAAFFAATDESSSPSRRTPMILFGALCGLMVVLIRVYGIYPDGTPFAILVANLFTPALSSIKPKPFGAK